MDFIERTGVATLKHLWLIIRSLITNLFLLIVIAAVQEYQLVVAYLERCHSSGACEVCHPSSEIKTAGERPQREFKSNWNSV